MGRGRVEVKLIQDKQARNVTFSKRKSGLMKKASQLSQLCDAEVALIIASSTGRVFCHGSPDGCMDEIIRRYKSTPEEEEARVKSEYQKCKELHSHLEKLKNKVSALEKMQRNLSGLDLHSLSPCKLERLEKKLAKGIGRIRNQQVKFFSSYKKTALMERSLKKDNARLKMQLERRMQETCNISERLSLQFGYNGKEQRHRAEVLQLFYDEGEKAAAARETGNAREIPYIFAWQSQGEGATTAANEEDAYNDHHHVREVPFICSLEPTENQTAVVTSQNGHVRDRDVPNISFLDLRLS